jgi:ankyrin repeat protein
VNVRDR